MTVVLVCVLALVFALWSVFVFRRWDDVIRWLCDNWKKGVVVAVVGGVVTSGVTIVYSPPPIPSAGVYSDWGYYRVCNINNEINSYQMRLNISWDGTLDGGEQVACNEHCNSNFSDIRFCDIDNTTTCDYWIEEKVDGNYCVVWIELPPSVEGDNKIIFYYGKTNAASESNGSNTWIYFEDFESYNDEDDITGWGVSVVTWKAETASPAEGNVCGRAENANTLTVGYIYKDISLDAPFRIFYYWKKNSQYQAIYYMPYDDALSTKAFKCGYYYSGNDWLYSDPSGNVIVPAAYTYDWYKAEVYVNSTHYNWTMINASSGASENPTSGFVQHQNSITINKTVYWQIGRAYSTVNTIGYYDLIRVGKYTDGAEPSWSSFGTEKTLGGYVNHPPEIKNPSPANDARKIQLQPTVSVYIEDDDGNTSTVDFFVSTDGTNWVHKNTQTNKLNETVQYTYTDANEYGKKYYWKVTANDGHDNTSSVFYFTTIWNATFQVVYLNESWTYYKLFVKHPYGMVKNNLNIFEVSKNISDNGNPDFIVWVNESSEKYDVSEEPGNLGVSNKNTGGQVVFSSNGTIWYTYGGRAGLGGLDFDLLSSNNSYDVFNFTLREDDWEETTGSTTPTISTNNTFGFLMWRELGSESPSSYVSFRRYNITNSSWHDSSFTSLVHGETVDLTDYGIEQLWQKFDRRNNRLFVSTMFLDNDGTYNLFGAMPFLYSDDDGNTWKLVNGSTASLPLMASDCLDDRTIAPHNHFAEGKLIGPSWFPMDLGETPDGKFYLFDRAGNWTWTGSKDTSKTYPYFWYWKNNQWNFANLTTEGVPMETNAVCAIGETKDYMCFVYTNVSENRTLFMKVSEDGGETWSSPYNLTMVPKQHTFCSGAYVLPYDYTDNYARFFIGYYNWAIVDGRKYDEKLMWVRINLSKYVTAKHSETIRKNGFDYFVWRDADTSAYHVASVIPGFDEATEYISILSNSGAWSNYYGDGSGTNFSVSTFDVIRTYLDDGVGTVTFTMGLISTYPETSRTVNLVKVGNGYNYTGWTYGSTTLSAENSTLFSSPTENGYWLALWNETNYEWDYWVCGFGCTGSNCDKLIHAWDVVLTKIPSNKSWSMP